MRKMTDPTPSLASAEGALEFVKLLHERVRSAARDTKTFSPIAFVFATRDPVSQVEFPEPKALPLSVDLLFEAMTDDQRAFVLDTFEDPTTFLNHVTRTAADKGKAVGVITLTSGDAAEGSYDTNTGEVVMGAKKRSVLLFMEHLRLKRKSWLADLSDEGAEDFQIGEFVELDGVPEGVDPTPLLPVYN